MPNITTFTFVFIGGALGSLLRWWLVVRSVNATRASFRWARS